MGKKQKEDSMLSIYRERFERHHDELRWLYMELYDNGDMFAELCDNLERFYRKRSQALRTMDID